MLVAANQNKIFNPNLSLFADVQKVTFFPLFGSNSLLGTKI